MNDRVVVLTDNGPVHEYTEDKSHTICGHKVLPKHYDCIRDQVAHWPHCDKCKKGRKK